jgi:predicted RecA/RadA family phage recombinase
MPQAVFVHEGEYIDHTPAADLAAGEVVVQGELVGVARTPVAAGRLGALAVVGVHDFAKAAGPAFTVGQFLYWDNAAKVAVSAAGGNKLIGKCVRAAAAADLIVRIRMLQ